MILGENVLLWARYCQPLISGENVIKAVGCYGLWIHLRELFQAGEVRNMRGGKVKEDKGEE